ncbi:arsenate reductase ArsC [Devosia geojensis]|uniref:arsenate reductase ArsC n=1 Tax=Devosia geojensis TaxID=443610 RepID=UPI00244ED1B2|nr:arsenate reductase ArsC [Devosia geojensis]
MQPYASRIDERASALPTVLFVCSMNSVRSPIAAALARQAFPGRLISRSVGVHGGKADSFVHDVMEEIGIDMSVHTPHTMDELAATRFDLVVTLSDDARQAVEEQGLETGAIEHWPVADPSLVDGNRDTILSAYRALRDDLRQRVRARLETLVSSGSQTT